MENNKIKICHVASIDITVKFLLLPQLKFLRGQGYDVHAVCSMGEWKKEIEGQGIKVKNIEIKRKITPVADIVSLFKLFFYFKKEKFDIVHTHTPKPGLLGQLAAKMAGVPIIINTVHGLYFSEDSSWLKKHFFILTERIAAACSDLIFSQNKEDIGTIIKEKIAKPEKIEYLGNGIDIGKFNPQRFSENFIKEKKKALGIEENFKIIGAVGRLVEEKGYLDLFEAFKKILKNFPQTALLVVGPEEPEKKDRFNPEIAGDYGIEKNTIFLGQRTDVDELYSLMDIFVLASWREGFPRTVIEAMAMELPIATTDIRGCREIVENGKNGILIPAKNSGKLAEAVIFLLENPEKANLLAKSARIKAVKEFDERMIFGRIKEGYNILLKKKMKLWRN